MLKKITTFLTTFVLLLCSSFLYAQNSACSVKDRVADLDFTLKDVSGADVQFSDYAGDVILLDFWSTWCAPCRIEIPGFIELLDEYGDQGFTVLGVSIDDAVPALEIYIEDMKMDYPVLIGDGRDDIKDFYGPLVGFPTTFMIDRTGNICHQHIGFATKEQFEQEILSLL
jgi:thiol-disulfide isomerase/thioredoxin